MRDAGIMKQKVSAAQGKLIEADVASALADAHKSAFAKVAKTFDKYDSRVVIEAQKKAMKDALAAFEATYVKTFNEAAKAWQSFDKA